MIARLNHTITSIEPDDSGLTKSMKYRSAMVRRIGSAIKRKASGVNVKGHETLTSLEDLKSLILPRGCVNLSQNASRPKILLLGPYHYKQPMWSVRAKAAIPDLISPLSQIAEVHWVTPIPNNDVLSTILKMSEQNHFHHHLLPPSYNLKTLADQAAVLDQLIVKINPQIVMNAFGIIASGFDAVTSAKRHNIISVLRIPGDELNAQKKMKNSIDNIHQEHLGLNKATFAIDNADQVMVMSDSEQKRISNEHQRKENMFVQIRGVDTSIFKPLTDKSFSNKQINVGFAGRLTLEKGTDILFETIEQLSSNSNVMFHIASPEEIASDVIQKCHNLKWHGYISHDHIPAFMKKMDVLILPSHMEGRSQTMMEAMACGLPVLMQKHIHPDQLPGMLHCDEKPASFVNQIMKLEADREYLTKLSDHARQSAIEHFDKTAWHNSMKDKFNFLFEGAMK